MWGWLRRLVLGGSLDWGSFMSIYLLACNKHGGIAGNFDHNVGGGWSPMLRRNLND